MDKYTAEAHHRRTSNRQTVITMGDKSPKAKEKSKQQHTADKDRKQAAAVQKAKPPAPGVKKGK